MKEQVSKKGSDETIYSWIGIDYQDEPCIYFFIREDWHKDITSHYQNKRISKDNMNIYYDSAEHEVYFEMTSEEFTKFTESNLDVQGEILSKFFNIYIEEVGQFL